MPPDVVTDVAMDVAMDVATDTAMELPSRDVLRGWQQREAPHELLASDSDTEI